MKNYLRENLNELFSRDGNISETCRKLGLNRQQVAKYLSGEVEPSVRRLRDICEHFGVSMDIARAPQDEATGPVQSIWRDYLSTDLERFFSTENPSDPQQPNGFYYSWKPSFLVKGKVVRNLAYFRTVDGITYFRIMNLHRMGAIVPARIHCMGRVHLVDDTIYINALRRKNERSVSYYLLRQGAGFNPEDLVGFVVGPGFNNVGTLRCSRVIFEKMKDVSLGELKRVSTVLREDEIDRNIADSLLLHENVENYIW